VTDLLHALQHEFALKDLGSQHYFLSIEVQRANDGLRLSQKKYTTDTTYLWLQRARMISCKPVSTPLTSYTKILAYDCDLLSTEDAM
jgi:hypothetical protein